MNGDQSFWGRRKAGVAAEAEAERAALEAHAATQEQQAREDQSDAEILDEFDLPDPDEMKMGDDFSAFMAKAVPDRIRRRALRTLWRSNPVLANVDMLVDYGEDFTDKATVIENIQTAYQIGKGMLKHVEEMARQEAERETPTEPEVPDEEVPDEDDANEAVVIAARDEAPEETLADVNDHADLDARDEEVAYVPPLPRRMKFTIEENAA